MTPRLSQQEIRELQELDELVIETDATDNANLAAVVLEKYKDWQRGRELEASNEKQV